MGQVDRTEEAKKAIPQQNIGCWNSSGIHWISIGFVKLPVSTRDAPKHDWHITRDWSSQLTLLPTTASHPTPYIFLLYNIRVLNRWFPNMQIQFGKCCPTKERLRKALLPIISRNSIKIRFQFTHTHTRLEGIRLCLAEDSNRQDESAMAKVHKEKMETKINFSLQTFWWNVKWITR